MPIKVSCKCGKKLSAPDSAAGKAVKCPGCGKRVRVPGGSTAKAKAKPAASRPRPTPAVDASDHLGSLFDEAGFSTQVESVCPSCRVEMAANAVLCTKCGYNKETGIQLESHSVAGVDIDHGTLALEKAANDLVKDQEMQKQLLKGGGMPWWMLVMVLVIGGGGLTLAVLAVNSANQETETEGPGLLASVLMLTGATFLFASVICFLIVAIHAFKQSIVKGLLTVFVPFYVFYHVFQHRSDVAKVFAMALVLGIAGAGAAYVGINMSDDVADPDDGSGLQMVL
jgi:hypothetical protein